MKLFPQTLTSHWMMIFGSRRDYCQNLVHPPLTAALHRLSLTLNTMKDDGYSTPLTLLVPLRLFFFFLPLCQFHFRLGFIIWSSYVEHFSHDWGV